MIGDPNGIRTRVASVKGWCVRPLHYGANWSGQQDLNLRPPAPKAGALAKLRYTPMSFHEDRNLTGA